MIGSGRPPSRARGMHPNPRSGVLPMTTPEDDPRVEALLREQETRTAERLSRRDLVVESAGAAVLLAGIAAMVAWLPAPATSSLPLAAALFALQLAATRVRFAVGSCAAVATEVAVVPMLM